MVNLTRYFTDYVITYTYLRGGLRRKRGDWDLAEVDNEVRLYVRCPECNKISSVEKRLITPEGFVGGNRRMTCIECRHCGDHFWPYLAGWEKSKDPLKDRLIHQWKLKEQ